MHASAAPATTFAQPALGGPVTIGSTRSAADPGGAEYTAPGDTLTVSAAWTGDPAVTYQWANCSSPMTCTDIPAATAASYTVVDADLGTVLQVTLTATNVDGSQDAFQTRDYAVGAPVPQSDQSGPFISTDRPGVGGGSTDSSVAYIAAGDVLTAASGTWAGSPTSYTYQWQRCTADGVTCSDISGATDASYTVQSADLDASIEVTVTATNPYGSTPWTAANTQSQAGVPAPVDTENNYPAVTSSNANDSFADAGDTLTVSTGSWYGDPTSYTFQWQRCTLDWSSCADISGATDAAYLLQSADRGSIVNAEVTAVNSVGARVVSTSFAFVIAAPTPVAGNGYPSVVSDHAGDYLAAGTTLTASNGTWVGSPTSFTYEWQDCDADFNCTPITGATSASYTLTAGDVGHYVSVKVTATNDAASGSADASFGDAPVGTPAIDAVNGSDPTLSAGSIVDAGGADVGPGDVLTVSTGTWDGTPTSYTYAWERCTANCDLIAGATASSYTVTSADNGAYVTASVTAANAHGSRTAWANGVNAGTSPAPTPPVTPPASTPVATTTTTTTTTPQPVQTVTSATSSSMAVPAGTAATLTLPSTAGTLAPAAISWSTGTFAGAVTVSASLTPASTVAGQSTVGGFGVGTVELRLLVKDAAGTELHHFPAALELTFTSPAPGFMPAYSEDGITWVSIPKLTGATLPEGQEDGYYAAADGSIHVLTRHATDFGLLTGLTLWGGTRSVVPHSATKLVVHLATGRASTAIVSLLTRSGKTLRKVTTPLTTQGSAVTLALPKHLKRDRYLIKVTATSSVVKATKTFVVTAG